jgi:hypothetical protein
VLPGARRARTRESAFEDLKPEDFGKFRPTPVERTAGFAFAADLIEEKARDTLDDAIVVRFGDPRVPLVGEGDETPVGDRCAE